MTPEIIDSLTEIRELLKLWGPATGPAAAVTPQGIGLTAEGTTPFSLPARTASVRFMATGGDAYFLYTSNWSGAAIKCTNGSTAGITFDCPLDLSRAHAFVFNGVSTTLTAWVTPAPT